MAPSSPPSSGEGAAADDPRFLPLERRAPTPDARCVEASLSSLSDDITPTNRFFIRSHFAVPRLTKEAWSLSVEGRVARPFRISFEELAALPQRELVAVLECAGNSRSTVRPKPEGVLWGHGAVGAARWRGVPLREVLERAEVLPSAREVVLEGPDRGVEPGVAGELAYAMSIDLAKAVHPDTLLALEMNGAPLAPSHGFPVRAIVPGYYGMASVKWVTRVEIVDEPFQGFFRARAYSYIHEGQRSDDVKVPVTSVRVKSLIRWPREGQVLGTGVHRLQGMAWSGEAAIQRVDISTTPASGAGEVWRPARLLPGAGRYSWTHWEALCEFPRPGFYVLRARATDELGHTQPLQAEWNFRGVGNNSVHAVPVEVRAGGGSDAA